MALGVDVIKKIIEARVHLEGGIMLACDKFGNMTRLTRERGFGGSGLSVGYFGVANPSGELEERLTDRFCHINHAVGLTGVLGTWY